MPGWMIFPQSLGRKLGLFSLLLLFFSPIASAEQVQIAHELRRLAARHHFLLFGTETLDDGLQGRLVSGGLYFQLRTLLEGLNYILIQNPDGGIQRLIVLGEKPVPPVPPVSIQSEPKPLTETIQIETQRRGAQHAVEVFLEGIGGKRVPRTLLIDTGADAVVLPDSLRALLGIPEYALRKRSMQTANGRVQAQVGKLPALWIGGYRIPEVQVAYLPEDKLGNEGLLGMNLLRRYRVTIDDQQGTLTLAPKGKPKP